MKNTKEISTFATPAHLINSPKFYLKKHKNNKYYVVISNYNSETKKNIVSYKSLKTKNKQIALTNFNTFVNAYLNNTTDIRINKNITLQDFYTEITTQLKANLNKNTVKIYSLTVKKFTEIAGNKMLRLISINDIELFKVNRLNQNVSKYEVNKELSTLKAILNISIKLNYLNKNVCKYVKKFAIEETKIKVFTETEINLLLNNIQNTLLLNIVKFAYLTGLRLNEILNIKISDIDINNNVINVFQSKTKKNKICIITDKLKSLLNEILLSNSPTPSPTNVFNMSTPDKYLFTVQNRNTNISKDYISHSFKKELRRFNLNEDLHFHSLRHTYISNLINAGTPLNFVKEIVQHCSIATTMRYITLNKPELIKYANMI